MLTIKIRHRPGKLEKGFTIVALIFFSGAFIPLIRQLSGFQFSVERGDIVSQAVFLGIELITFSLLVPRWKSAWRVGTRNLPLLLLILYAFASVFWSVNFSVSFRRGVAMLGTALFGVYLVTRYSMRDQMQLLVWSLAIAALLSLAAAIVTPSLGITSGTANTGSWRGIFTQKNTLGRMMGLSAILSFAIAITERRYRYWLLFGLSIGLVVMARSVTPLLSALITLPLIPLYSFIRHRWPPMMIIPAVIVMIFLGMTIVAIITANLDFFFGLLGKDLTLTGRTKLWSTVWGIGNETNFHRWFGYGYSGFWLGADGESARVWRVITWKPKHAHNGFLDIWLDLGFVGLVLFGITLLLAVIRSIRRIGEAHRAEDIWPFLFLVYFLIVNVTQGVVMRPNNLFWTLFVSIALVLSPGHKRIRFFQHKVSRVSTRETRSVPIQSATHNPCIHQIRT